MVYGDAGGGRGTAQQQGPDLMACPWEGLLGTGLGVMHHVLCKSGFIYSVLGICGRRIPGTPRTPKSQAAPVSCASGQCLQVTCGRNSTYHVSHADLI